MTNTNIKLLKFKLFKRELKRPHTSTKPETSTITPLTVFRHRKTQKQAVQKHKGKGGTRIQVKAKVQVILNTLHTLEIRVNHTMLPSTS